MTEITANAFSHADAARIYGKRLSDILKAKNISQSELAKLVWGTHTDYRGFQVSKNRDRISNYVSGRILPSATTRASIAAALRVKMAELEKGLDYKPSAMPGHMPPAMYQTECSMTGVPGAEGEVYVRLSQRMPKEAAQRLVNLFMILTAVNEPEPAVNDETNP